MANSAWNPLDCHSRFTLSGGNLVAAGASVAAAQGVCIAAGKSAGLFYAEIRVTGTFSGNTAIGVNTLAPTWSAALNSDLSGAYAYSASSIFYNGTSSGFTIGSWVANDVICIALDLGNSKVWFRRNAGNWDGNATHNPATNAGGISLSTLVASGRPWFLVAGAGSSATPTFTLNTGDTAFAQAVPSGFTAGWPDNGAVANGATFNPATVTTGLTLSNGNLTLSSPASPGGSNKSAKGTGSEYTGKYYWEYNVNDGLSTSTLGVGIANANTLGGAFYTNATDGALCYSPGTAILLNGSSTGISLAAYVEGNVIGIALDLSARLLWVRVSNGNWNASGTANPATGTGGINIAALTGNLFPAIGGNAGTTAAWRVSLNTTNFSKIPAPSGFSVGPPATIVAAGGPRQYAVTVNAA